MKKTMSKPMPFAKGGPKGSMKSAANPIAGATRADRIQGHIGDPGMEKMISGLQKSSNNGKRK
jgi:hypothetical protein